MSGRQSQGGAKNTASPKNPPFIASVITNLTIGDLVLVKPLGTPMLFVNSADVARDLFDKRSSIYSDHHIFPMLMMYVSAWYSV